MNKPIDNTYIGITTPFFRDAANFYIRHFGYELVADHGDFVSVRAPNGKRCLGFSDSSAEAPHNVSGVSLTFLVDDISIALQQFQSSGIPIRQEIQIGSWGAPHFVLSDPAGVDIYVSERAPWAEQGAAANP